MNRVLRAMLVLVCFEMGALLLYLPWSGYWDQNYFLNHFPSLMIVVLHPSFRGVVKDVDEASSRLSVAVTIYGRVVAADLEFGQVQRL